MSVLCAVLLFGCGTPLNDRVPQNEIFDYVNANYELLEAFPYDEMPKGLQLEEQEEYLHKYLGSETIVKGVYSYNDNILDFYCGGSGLSPASTYVGFYRSNDDTPFALIFDGHELEETKPGVFEWRNEDGTHHIRTERIRKNWFAYDIKYH